MFDEAGKIRTSYEVDREPFDRATVGAGDSGEGAPFVHGKAGVWARLAGEEGIRNQSTDGHQESDGGEQRPARDRRGRDPRRRVGVAATHGCGSLFAAGLARIS